MLTVLSSVPFPKVERTDSLELIPAMANSRKPSTPGTVTGAMTLTTTSLLSASQASFRYCVVQYGSTCGDPQMTSELEG